jgi:hypothetical protein
MDESANPRPDACVTTFPIEVPSENVALTEATVVALTAPLSIAGRLTTRAERVAGEPLTVAWIEPLTVVWKVPVRKTTPGLTPWTVDALTVATVELLDTKVVYEVSEYVAPFVRVAVEDRLRRWYADVHWYCRMKLLGLRDRVSPPATSTTIMPVVLAERADAEL